MGVLWTCVFILGGSSLDPTNPILAKLEGQVGESLLEILCEFRVSVVAQMASL